jgi:hypothetical protein
VDPGSSVTFPTEKLNVQYDGVPTGWTVTGTFPEFRTEKENVAVPPVATVAEVGPTSVASTEVAVT